MRFSTDEMIEWGFKHFTKHPKRKYSTFWVFFYPCVKHFVESSGIFYHVRQITGNRSVNEFSNEPPVR